MVDDAVLRTASPGNRGEGAPSTPPVDNAWHNAFNRFQRCFERREKVIVAVSSPHDRDEGGRKRTDSFARPGPALRDQLRDYDPKYRCPHAHLHGRHKARDLRTLKGRGRGAIA